MSLGIKKWDVSLTGITFPFLTHISKNQMLRI